MPLPAGSISAARRTTLPIKEKPPCPFRTKYVQEVEDVQLHRDTQQHTALGDVFDDAGAQLRRGGLAELLEKLRVRSVGALVVVTRL